MHVRDSGGYCPGEDPETNGEGRTSDRERSNFGFGEHATFLCAELFEEVVVVEAGEDVEEDADEDGDEG